MVKSNRMKGRLKIIQDNINWKIQRKKDPLFNSSEAMEYLDMGYKFFKLHSDQGSLKHVLIGCRKHFYKSELDNFKNKIQITS